MNTRIISVDCATTVAKVGLASAAWGPQGLHDVALHPVGGRSKLAETPARLRDEIVRLLEQSSGEPVLLALDAPLGWPEAMLTSLPRKAGDPIDAEADRLFRRETDRAIEARLGRRVLEVGANLIARTAYMALGLLAALREDQPDWSLAMSPDLGPGFHFIEIYPAGTALEELPPEQQQLLKGYKADASKRAELLGALAAKWLCLEGLAPRNDHEMDALIGILAAARFLAGDSPAPSTDEQRRLATVEGWIWL